MEPPTLAYLNCTIFALPRFSPFLRDIQTASSSSAFNVAAFTFTVSHARPPLIFPPPPPMRSDSAICFPPISIGGDHLNVLEISRFQQCLGIPEKVRQCKTVISQDRLVHLTSFPLLLTFFPIAPFFRHGFVGCF